MSSPKILEMRPLDAYKIWLKFDDGIAGEVDLSHLAGKGVFSLWNNYENFKKVRWKMAEVSPGLMKLILMPIPSI